MSTEPRLSASGEEAWLSLRRRLEWAEDFSLSFLFCASPLLVDLLRTRLERIYLTRVSQLQRAAPASPADAVQEIMALIRNSSEIQQAVRSPLWIELYQDRANDQPWAEARANTLQRLNEHRELLRKGLRRPMVLVLPLGYRQKVMELIPDLWAIRELSLDLDPSLALQPGKVEPREWPEKPSYEGVLGSTEYNQALLSEWQRLATAPRSREMLSAGWQAVDAALALQRLDSAPAIAARVVDLARETVRQTRPGLRNRIQRSVAKLSAFFSRTPRPRAQPAEGLQAERDLSVSLNKLGDVARTLSRYEEAESAYRESLE
ncbi:MAG: hypothetical protein L0191_11025, partial [Acidobacteria bacterium]|nr:hypothetical protein [Acidobacteriota bacterium]